MSNFDENTPLLRASTTDSALASTAAALSQSSKPSKLIPTIVLYTGVPGKDEPQIVCLVTRNGNPATSRHGWSKLPSLLSKGKDWDQAFSLLDAGKERLEELLNDTDIPLSEMAENFVTEPGMSECRISIMGPQWEVPEGTSYRNLMTLRHHYDTCGSQISGEFQPAVMLKVDSSSVHGFFPYVTDASSRPVFSDSKASWREAMNTECELRNFAWNALVEDPYLSVGTVTGMMDVKAKSDGLSVPRCNTLAANEFNKWVWERLKRSDGKISWTGEYPPEYWSNVQQLPFAD